MVIVFLTTFSHCDYITKIPCKVHKSISRIFFFSRHSVKIAEFNSLFSKSIMLESVYLQVLGSFLRIFSVSFRISKNVSRYMLNSRVFRLILLVLFSQLQVDVFCKGRKVSHLTLTNGNSEIFRKGKTLTQVG